jgi:hypothetical protein
VTEVVLTDPRVDPEPAGWAEFRRQCRLHPVWAYDLMRVESWLSRNPVLLATVRDGDRIAAAMSVLVCVSWRSPRYAPAPGSRSRSARPRMVEVVQPWLSGYPGIVFADGVAPGQRRAVVARFERALVRHLGPGLAGVLYRQLGDDDVAALSGRFRLARAVDPVAVLHNTFTDEEQWLASLHRKRRAALRRQRRIVAADESLVVRGGPGRTDLDWTEASALINRHRARFPRPLVDNRTPVAARYLAAYLGRSDVHTLTYHDTSGRLLALHVMMDNGHSPALQHWAALRVEEGGRQHLYFDAHCRAVKFAVTRGRTELTDGRGMLDVKSELGFGTRGLHTVAVPRPVLGRLF